MSKFSVSLLCTAAALALAGTAAAQATMTPVTAFGTNGWIAPGASPYVTTGNTERGLAYNPLTGNLVLVARQNVAGISNNVRVLDGATGADLVGFDNTGMTGGTFVANMVAIADDGAIYVSNLSTTATTNFKVYKWDAEVLGPVVPPTVVYDALTGLARTGDTFAVEGGLVTPAQFAAAGSNAVSASNFIVGSLDGLNTGTAFLSVPGTTTATNDYRLGLTFVDSTTLIGTQGATARLTPFDTVTATAFVSATMPLGGASRRAMDYAVIGGRPVLAVIDTVSSIVTVLDVTDPSNPVAIVSGTTTSGTLTANGNGTGGVAWGAITGNTAKLYAMSSNQGIQAFTVDLSPLGSVTTYGAGCDGLGLAVTGAPVLGNAAFQLDLTNVPAISPIAFVAFGSSSVNPGIDLTFLGMAGCFSYTSFDLGLFQSGAVAGGASTFAFPIPNTPSLAGASFASQGVSLSLATAFGLATSNGAELLLGF